MKKTFLLITALALSLTAASAARIYTPQEIAAESNVRTHFWTSATTILLRIILRPPPASGLRQIMTNGTIFPMLKRRLTWPPN
jgi:hypothetical protein